MLVVPQGAAQQAQVVECQYQNHHAAQSNTANPPVSKQSRLTLKQRNLVANNEKLSVFERQNRDENFPSPALL